MRTGVVKSLPAKIGVQSVEISTIAHATDDLAKVQTALCFLLPESMKERTVFRRRYLQGHHGNAIVTFDVKLNRFADVEQFSTHFLRQLPRNERLLIKRDLEMYTDAEGNLYIRLGKQQAYRGILELSEEDPIRVKMKFSRLSGEAKGLMQRLLELE